MWKWKLRHFYQCCINNNKVYSYSFSECNVFVEGHENIVYIDWQIYLNCINCVVTFIFVVINFYFVECFDK